MSYTTVYYDENPHFESGNGFWFNHPSPSKDPVSVTYNMAAALNFALSTQRF